MGEERRGGEGKRGEESILLGLTEVLLLLLLLTEILENNNKDECLQLTYTSSSNE